MPLAVTFSGLGSTDPDAGDVLTYAWDLDGDNLLDDSTLAQPTFTYENPGTYTVTLQVTDTRGATALATVTITVTDSGLRTLRFSPIADSRVEAANSGTNYGTQTKLRTDGSPQVESLLRFNVAGITGTVQSAKLRLSALADGTADGPALYTAASGWTETGVKWSNRPTFGAIAMGDKGAVAANSVIEYDVKSLVTGNGELNLGLRQTSGDSLELASREDTTAARRPVLEVTYALPAPDPDPTRPTRTRRRTRQPGPGSRAADIAVRDGSEPHGTGDRHRADAGAAGGRHAEGAQAARRDRARQLRSPCTLTASATVSLAGASRSLKLRGIVRQAASGKQVRLRLALSSKTLRSIRRALRRGVKLTAKVTVVATDAAGNSSKSTRRIRLKR